MSHPYVGKPSWQCPHCREKSTPVSCVTCQRNMCEDCISYGDAGKVCGLCRDRELAHHRYDRLVQRGYAVLPFDEWYDQDQGHREEDDE